MTDKQHDAIMAMLITIAGLQITTVIVLILK